MAALSFQGITDLAHSSSVTQVSRVLPMSLDYCVTYVPGLYLRTA